jgi:hypothetical protein
MKDDLFSAYSAESSLEAGRLHCVEATVASKDALQLHCWECFDADGTVVDGLRDSFSHGRFSVAYNESNEGESGSIHAAEVARCRAMVVDASMETQDTRGREGRSICQSVRAFNSASGIS